MAYDEEVYEKLLGSFGLLCNIIRQNAGGNSFKVDLSKLEEIIHKKIPDTLKKNAPEDFYELYMDFKSEYERFRDFILYDKLIGKNIIALGGGFSSGKSSFLNELMGKQVLPSDIDPSTSVPTYIVKGGKHEVIGVNVFDAKIRMQPRDIKKVAHGFGEVEDEDGEKVTEAVTLGHVLENIFFSTPLHQYDNIAFLDTPGYSKPDSEKYSAKTAEQLSRGQLNSSNLRSIIEKIKATLDVKGVRYLDVLAFTSRAGQVQERQLGDFIKKDTAKIKAQIEKWNSQIYESNFARNFKLIFVRCKEFYEEEINQESKKLTRLNTSITKLSAEDIDYEILEPLQQLVKEAQRNVNELKDIGKKLKELQNEFFTEIKFISDIVGISMPEPSEIDLIQDKVKNPIQMLEEYKKEKGIRTDSSVADLLQDIFDGIEPVINKTAGGNTYKNELLDVILERCDLAPEEIHINDVYKSTAEYAQLIRASR